MSNDPAADQELLPTPLIATISAIHAAPPRLVYAFAGAGSLALFWLHAVAGSSRTVLEAVDCYAPGSLASIAGTALAPAVSPATAAAMADWAYARAIMLADQPGPLLGIACTAAITTDRTRRGADRAFVAVRGPTGPRRYALNLRDGNNPTTRDRLGQEYLVSHLVLMAIAEACDLPAPPLDLLPGEGLERRVG
ncbi:MAG: hypothetical protein AB4911_01860 [Oscillochloridaceae bacterium umkhey_bin13]